jgi:hypoxanthine phosphoribosyltransferase
MGKEELLDRLNEDYKNYLALLVGEERAEEATSFNGYAIWGYSEEEKDTIFGRSCTAIENLKENYDLGLALATDGLYLGYISKVFNFPTLNVKLKRRGFGATWKPIDEISEDTVGNKRLLVYDNDSVSGRTLKRASRELMKFHPKTMDLLLIHKHTPTSRDCTKNVPSNFGKVMTLQNDFVTDSKAVEKFYQQIKEQ